MLSPAFGKYSHHEGRPSSGQAYVLTATKLLCAEPTRVVVEHYNSLIYEVTLRPSGRLRFAGGAVASLPESCAKVG